MAHTNNWDETIPTNTTNAIDIDDHIRKVRLDIRERMAVDHDINSSDSAEAEIGIHKKITIKQKISAPTPSQNNQAVIHRLSGDNDSELRMIVKNNSGVTQSHKLTFVGEVKFWLGLEANIPAGWLALKGSTVGNTGSGATYTGSSYQDLYYHLWNNLDNTAAPVSTGRGANAAADWTALKTITMPDGRSKMVIGGGQASGMTLRKEGYIGGDETKDVSHAHGMNSHTHNVATLGTTTHSDSNLTRPIIKVGSNMYYPFDGSDSPSKMATYTEGPSTANTESAGSATQDVMNPWIAIWMIIKY